MSSRGRLPSFKGPRDLSLGSGAASSRATRAAAAASDQGKKKFVPNLNVQRREKSTAEDPAPKGAAQAQSKPTIQKKSQPRVKFQRPELIQTIGTVFSEGMGSDSGPIRRRYGMRGSEADSSAIERPKINLKTSLEAKFDKAAEEEQLKELLRDDFIDDLKTGSLLPVQLPMIDAGKCFTSPAVKKEESLSDDDEIKAHPMVKNRIADSDDEGDALKAAGVKVKEEPLSDDEQKSTVIKKELQNAEANKAPTDFCMADLVKAQKGDLIFIQLPDRLPGITHFKEGVSPAQPYQLSNMPEGYMGKIQIRKSGRTQLKLGEVLLDVDMGTQVAFLQDLVSVQAPASPANAASQSDNQSPVGSMTILGHVRHRLIITPNWDHMLASGFQCPDAKPKK